MSRDEQIEALHLRNMRVVALDDQRKQLKELLNTIPPQPNYEHRIQIGLWIKGAYSDGDLIVGDEVVPLKAAAGKVIKLLADAIDAIEAELDALIGDVR